jgi:hypothetical protein
VDIRTTFITVSRRKAKNILTESLNFMSQVSGLKVFSEIHNVSDHMSVVNITFTLLINHIMPPCFRHILSSGQSIYCTTFKYKRIVLINKCFIEIAKQFQAVLSLRSGKVA